MKKLNVIIIIALCVIGCLAIEPIVSFIALIFVIIAAFVFLYFFSEM